MILHFTYAWSHHDCDTYNSKKPSPLKYSPGIVALQLFIIKGQDALNRKDDWGIIL